MNGMYISSLLSNFVRKVQELERLWKEVRTISPRKIFIFYKGVSEHYDNVTKYVFDKARVVASILYTTKNISKRQLIDLHKALKDYFKNLNDYRGFLYFKSPNKYITLTTLQYGMKRQRMNKLLTYTASFNSILNSIFSLLDKIIYRRI